MARLPLANIRSFLARFARTSIREFSAREYSFNLVLAAVIGLVGGYGAVVFRIAIAAVERLAFGTSRPGIEFILGLPWYLRFLIPVAGGLIVGPIVTFISTEARGHGVPEVMEAAATKGGLIRGRVAAAKVAASAVTLGTGGSAGWEGPIVQIGSSIASKLGQILHVGVRRMRTFVACGAAAGIAATFNAPVAGMLFSVEIILGDFGMAHLSPIIVSSVVATAVSRAYLGAAPAFAVPGYEMVSAVELIHYAALGVAAGFVAVAFTRTLDATDNFFERLEVPDWLKPAIGGVAIGLFGVVGFPHVFGVGYEFIGSALRGHLPLLVLLALIAGKIVATSATLGSGGSGGILAPSLFIGAMTGGVVWYGAQALTPTLVPANYGAYALVGMAAVLASTTRAPLQAILIIFELTGGYEVILPLMLSSIIAVVVGNYLMEESIYTVKLRARGILLRRGTEINVLRGIRVGEVMSRDVRTVPHHMRLRPLLDVIAEAPARSSIYVLDGEGRLQGSISYREIRRILFDVEALERVLVAGDLARAAPTAITPDETLDVVMRLLARQNLDELPVVAADRPDRIIGTIHRADVDAAYDREIMNRDLLGSVRSGLEEMQRARSAPMAPGFAMAEIEVPAHMVGRDLRSLDLRNREGIEIILVRRSLPDRLEGVESLVPKADLVLQHGDIMLISGPQRVVERLANR